MGGTGLDLALLNGWALAQWAVRTAQRRQFWALPKPHGPGAPPVYRDESVLLTSLGAAAWRLSYEVVINWLARCDDLAEALGYDQFDEQGQRRTISRAAGLEENLREETYYGLQPDHHSDCVRSLPFDAAANANG